MTGFKAYLLVLFKFTYNYFDRSIVGRSIASKQPQIHVDWLSFLRNITFCFRTGWCKSF